MKAKMNIFLKNINLIIISFIISACISACAGDSNEPQYIERSVEDIYNTALDRLIEGDFTEASEEFDEVERQHPYSIWAKRSLLMSTYSRYQRNDYELAIASALRYIELYPSSENVDYAYYLIAISYYEQINDIARDQGNTQRALAAFDELIARFPDGEYARDGRAKRDLALDHLAGQEMEVGRTYLSLKQYLASIKRFQNVIEKYQSTSHVPEALARITEVYLILGVKEEAQAAAAVLGYNYPRSEWYNYAYKLLTKLEEKKKQQYFFESFF